MLEILRNISKWFFGENERHQIIIILFAVIGGLVYDRQELKAQGINVETNHHRYDSINNNRWNNTIINLTKEYQKKFDSTNKAHATEVKELYEQNKEDYKQLFIVTDKYYNLINQ